MKRWSDDGNVEVKIFDKERCKSIIPMQLGQQHFWLPSIAVLMPATETLKNIFRLIRLHLKRFFFQLANQLNLDVLFCSFLFSSSLVTHWDAVLDSYCPLARIFWSTHLSFLCFIFRNSASIKNCYIKIQFASAITRAPKVMNYSVIVGSGATVS